jgi:hypothetical protein
LPAYLTNTTDPVSLVMDLHIDHDRFVSSSDPSLYGHLHYPNDIDKSLNEDTVDKIRKYRTDYYNNPPTSVTFISAIISTSGRLQCCIVNSLDCYSYRLIGKLTAFLQRQEFILSNPTVEYYTSATRRSRHPESKSRQQPRQNCRFTCQFEC